MTGAPRRPKPDEITPARPDHRRKKVPLETFEQDARTDRDTGRAVEDNPDGSARALDPSERREGVVDEA